ncbi:MAG TPA: hypothetical protein VGK54_13660 [Chloroflexota bacterium]
MADIRGVGKPITYTDHNPITEWIGKLHKERDALKRPPADEPESEMLGRWLGYRGRDELEEIVGSACYAYSHFDIDPEWRFLLADHIRVQAGQGWGYIRQADAIDPSREHADLDPEFEQEYGLTPRVEHHDLQRRDFLSYIIAGNLWPYGHVTTATVRRIVIATPGLLEFEEHALQTGELSHHAATLQKIHDYIWELIEEEGEEPVRKRIAEIDSTALNHRSRATFDPARREFLRKYLSTTFENVAKFHEWREYLYLNVLGFPPEPVTIQNWPAEIPQPAP